MTVHHQNDTKSMAIAAAAAAATMRPKTISHLIMG